MSWLGIEGHDAIVELFRRSIAAGRLGSTFLFVGPAGVGKRTFAMRLAQSLLCEQAQLRPLDPCGACPACAQVLARSHPDLDIITKPDDKNFIPLQLLIGEKQHRLREGLCARIAMRPAHGGRKVGIIDDADYLNQEGANCLLKTLEEPPASSILILIGTSPQRQLPTIRSRCQIVRFQPLEHSICARLLRELELASDKSQAQQLATLCQGSLARAADWSDPALCQFSESFRQTLSDRSFDTQRLSKQVADFVDSAGKEAPKRRARLHLVMEIATQFYREAMRNAVGADSSTAAGGEVASQAGQRRTATSISAEVAADCVERTEAARWHIAANANQATNIDAWLDDLSQITLGRYVSHY